LNPLPDTVEDLIKELETLYPPRCVAVGDTLEAAHRYAGSVELIEALRIRFNWTRDNALPKELLHVRPKDQRSGARR
jgi:hypothetical protein